jgi:protein-S-isoprenylcysteine O-methyltransferase Ste14
VRIKGFDILREHAPELDSRWGRWRALLSIGGVFALTTVFFMAADRGFAEWMPDGEIVVLAIGFLVLSRFFSQREVYRRKYGELSYWMAFVRFYVPGTGIVMASIAHLAYIAGPGIPDIWWKPWLVAAGWLLVLLGAKLGLRAVEVAGIDNLAMLHVYYPSESEFVKSKIYSAVRHPLDSAALDVGFGLALIHANWYGLLVALILPIFFAGWVRLIEEPELIRRFASYVDYRRRVPAFWPKPSGWLAFFKYLILPDQ